MTLNRSVQNVNPGSEEIFDQRVHNCRAPAYGGRVAVAEARGRGRPRQFDEDQVLDALVQLFWDKGYEDASLQEIVDAAGLNKSSLYNAFGSKDEIFFAAVERYMALREAMLDEAFTADGGFDQIERFLDMLRMESRSAGGGRGCLAVNATTELGLREDRIADIAARYRTMLGGRLRTSLEQAAADGDIDPAMVQSYADVIVGVAVSIAVAARSGAPVGELERQIDSLAALVAGWRI